MFEQPHMTILSGHVEGKIIKVLREHLRVEIRSPNDPSKVEATLPLPLSNFFQVKDLPKGKYLLQLRSVLPPNIHRFKAEVIEVDLEKHTQIHVGPLNYTLEEEHHKQVGYTICSSDNRQHHSISIFMKYCNRFGQGKFVFGIILISCEFPLSKVYYHTNRSLIEIIFWPCRN